MIHTAWRLTAFATLALSAFVPPTHARAQQFDPQTQFDRHFASAQYDAAEATARQALAAAEARRDDHAAAGWDWKLAKALSATAHYDESKRCYERALAYFEAAEGAASVNVATLLGNLGIIELELGQFEQAEALHRRALDIQEKTPGGALGAARILNSLGIVLSHQERVAEAATTFERALAIHRQLLGDDDVRVAESLNNLAIAYEKQGRFADAVLLYRRVMTIHERHLGGAHPRVADALANMAVAYYYQGLFEEAEPLFRRALALREAAFDADHPLVAASLQHLGGVYYALERFAEAEPLYRRAVAIQERALGNEHPGVARCLDGLAMLYRDQKRYDEAEVLFRRAIAIYEKSHGPENASLAHSLHHLAGVYVGQKRYADALSLAGRALSIRERAMSAPGELGHSYALRATCAWHSRDRAAAIADLRRAMDLVEEQRGQASGGEQERATLFGMYAYIYERMVDWQCELGDVGQAFDAMERARARSLIDEINAAGVDLRDTLPREEREAYLRQESELAAQVAALERRLQAAMAAENSSDAERTSLEEQLAAARKEVYDHWRTIRTESRVYRDLLTVDSSVPTLSQIQDRLVGADGLMLAYFLGGDDSYVALVTADAARIERLSLDEDAANVLGVEAGPLTAERLQAAFTNDRGDGVLQRLAHPASALAAADQLAALWRVLVPEQERLALAEGLHRSLIVLPDGPLSLLPFETLVIERAAGGAAARYLLDAGVPIVHAPSATILLNLKERSASAPDAAMPVLTVADPNCARASSSGELPDAIRPSARYATVGGPLEPLPFTGIESTWVKSVFDPVGLKTGRLLKDTATEAAVRAAVASRQIVHLACHGLTDSEYGNFFGALALTPGQRAETDARDDGFLTLAEIYELNLKSCELAVLSACQTNYGPQQQGEGTWALSRGFLVAGARRVVASNWLVDDEAAASLISYFCGGLAAAEQQHIAPNHARSLHEAKRWVRRQPKWQSPYYWGTFVLVGPS